MAHDLAENYSSSVLNGYIDPSLGSFLFDSFLKTPNKNDAEMFKGVLFEDAIGPNIRRYLFVPDEYKNDKKTIDNMIWKEAASLFINPTPSQDAKIKSELSVTDVNNTVSTKKDKIDKVQPKPIESKKNRFAVIERAVFGLFLRDGKRISILGIEKCFLKILKINLFYIIIIYLEVSFNIYRALFMLLWKSMKIKCM